MEDIIQKYKHERKIRNISVVITSLVLALGLNLFLTNTDGGKYLKSSVINSSVWVEKKADLYLENKKNSWNIILNLKSSKEMVKIKSMSFSLVYNKDNVILKNKNLNIDWVDLVNVTENDWYNTIILNFKNPTNIKSWDNILNIVLEKKDILQKENLNLVNSNITDEENNLFSLSTSWVEF